MADLHVNQQLEGRMLVFSVAVVKHCARLKQPLVAPLINQVVRSASSIGANFVEANNSSSKRDFRNKIFIAKKEANETKYWLSMFEKLGDTSDELKDLIRECQEFIMVLQKITSSLGS
jgi:four helix bundle protein